MGMDLVPVCPSGGGSDAGGVRIDARTQQITGVRTAVVEERQLSRTIRAAGRVTYDERRVAHVHPKVQGWVEHLYVDFIGQTVRRGEPLLEIYSPELVATQEELLLAARYRDTTAKSPFEDVSRGGTSLYEATRRRLELWDVHERDVKRLLATGEVKRTLTLYAPSAGVVTELGVRSGMEVGPSTSLYTIADLSRVWVVADVYEFELPWVELGQTGRVELSYLPGIEFTGPVTYIAPFLDPASRTAQVRLELPNPDGKLKPEMFGNMLIEAAPRQRVTALPSEAVIRSGRRTLVIVDEGGRHFAQRDVELGIEGDGWIEVRSGVEVGDEIVVSGQFLIDSESKLEEAARRPLKRDDEGTASAGEAGEHSMPMPDRSNEHGAHQ
jgi:Cu(I)/Ag(I) efflux system membrane fusion protein